MSGLGGCPNHFQRPAELGPAEGGCFEDEEARNEVRFNEESRDDLKEKEKNKGAINEKQIFIKNLEGRSIAVKADGRSGILEIKKQTAARPNGQKTRSVFASSALANTDNNHTFTMTARIAPRAMTTQARKRGVDVACQNRCY